MMRSPVVLAVSMSLVACFGGVEASPPIVGCEDAAAPLPVADAGRVEAAAPDDDACNAEYQRGRCDDRLVPSAWGFLRSCETDGGRAYKPCAVGPDFRCELRDALRAKCVETANDVVCCPES